MIQRDFEAISKDDIDALVVNQTAEVRTTEYKLQLPAGSDEGTREFLADASSLANADGGDLIFGIREKKDKEGKATGIPEAAEGLAGINPDAQILRLEAMIRDSIDPRIPGIRTKPVLGFPLGPVIIVRIPKSWAPPHMVKFKHSSRFFSRNSAGKYQLDVREIRASFLASENTGATISAFRTDRVGKIASGETPVPIAATPKLVVHLLPVQAFSGPAFVDMKAAKAAWNPQKVPPMGKANQWSPPQFNFNGLFGSGIRGSIPDSYVQMFRNGAIEALCIIQTHSQLLSGSAFEQELLREVPKYLKYQKELGVQLPIFVAISLLFVKGFRIYPTLNPSPFGFFHVNPINEHHLLAPEALIEETGGPFPQAVRLALDTIWQASGWDGSPGYDEDGKWVGYVNYVYK